MVDDESLIDGLLARKAFPIGQDVRGDEVDRRCKFRMLQPDIPDLTCRNRHIDGALYALNELDEI